MGDLGGELGSVAMNGNTIVHQVNLSLDLDLRMLIGTTGVVRQFRCRRLLATAIGDAEQMDDVPGFSGTLMSMSMSSQV